MRVHRWQPTFRDKSPPPPSLPSRGSPFALFPLCVFQDVYLKFILNLFSLSRTVAETFGEEEVPPLVGEDFPLLVRYLPSALPRHARQRILGQGSAGPGYFCQLEQITRDVLSLVATLRAEVESGVRIPEAVLARSNASAAPRLGKCNMEMTHFGVFLRRA